MYSSASEKLLIALLQQACTLNFIFRKVEKGMKEKIGVNDMNNVSGGFGINHHGSFVQLTKISDSERKRLIAYCEAHANEIAEPDAMVPVGEEGTAPTFGDWAEQLKAGSTHAPVMPVSLAAEIFPENARLQRLAGH